MKLYHSAICKNKTTNFVCWSHLKTSCLNKWIIGQVCVCVCVSVIYIRVNCSVFDSRRPNGNQSKNNTKQHFCPLFWRFSYVFTFFSLFARFTFHVERISSTVNETGIALNLYELTDTLRFCSLCRNFYDSSFVFTSIKFHMSFLEIFMTTKKWNCSVRTIRNTLHVMLVCVSVRFQFWLVLAQKSVSNIP